MRTVHMAYDDIRDHQLMLQDRRRTDGFRLAIEATVRKGDVVLDFGCGTGILSFFAKKAGARTVYSVDRSPIIKVAKRIARDNNLEGIHFLSGEGETVALPEPVDVVVSEWMGDFIFREDMLPPLVRLVHTYLRPGGLCVPRTVTPCLALVTDPSVHEDCAFFRTRPYDIDFSLVEDWPFFHPQVSRLRPDQVDATMVGESLELQRPRNISVIRARMVAEHDVTAYALCGWFSAELAPGIDLRTGPHDPETHWQQLVFPLANPLHVAQGTTVDVAVHPLRLGPTRQLGWRWSISAGGERRHYDNVMHRVWLQVP